MEIYKDIYKIFKQHEAVNSEFYRGMQENMTSAGWEDMLMTLSGNIILSQPLFSNNTNTITYTSTGITGTQSLVSISEIGSTNYKFRVVMSGSSSAFPIYYKILVTHTSTPAAIAGSSIDYTGLYGIGLASAQGSLPNPQDIIKVTGLPTLVVTNPAFAGTNFDISEINEEIRLELGGYTYIFSQEDIFKKSTRRFIHIYATNTSSTTGFFTLTLNPY